MLNLRKNGVNLEKNLSQATKNALKFCIFYMLMPVRTFLYFWALA
jgi:hypothetical protein